MNDHTHFAIAAEDVLMPASRDRADDWRLLRRLALPVRMNNPRGGAINRAIVLDVETTGLSKENDKVIPLAMLPFTYEIETGRILEIKRDRAFDGFRQPGLPISEEASIITGLTDEMLAGHTIDIATVEVLVADVDLVIAHNASFDRVMVEKHWPCFAHKPWVCTLTSIDWLREEYLIRALDAPYDLRIKLKERGYRWRPAELPNGKVWWTTITDPRSESTWLKKEIYGQEIPIPVHPITALERYSERLWDFKR